MAGDEGAPLLVGVIRVIAVFGSERTSRVVVGRPAAADHPANSRVDVLFSLSIEHIALMSASFRHACEAGRTTLIFQRRRKGVEETNGADLFKRRISIFDPRLRAGRSRGRGRCHGQGSGAAGGQEKRGKQDGAKHFVRSLLTGVLAAGPQRVCDYDFTKDVGNKEYTSYAANCLNGICVVKATRTSTPDVIARRWLSCRTAAAQGRSAPNV